MKTFRFRPLQTPGIPLALCFFTIGLFMAAGCATPDIKTLSDTRVLAPDQEDDIGGSFAESGDIRTVAVKMCGELLSTPEIASSADAVRIAIAPIRNSSRFVIDKDIFMKRLRIEMNKVANGRVRFFSQGVGQGVRQQILQEQTEDQWMRLTDEAAESIVSFVETTNPDHKIKIAVIPVKNTNLVGVNADSLTSLVRSGVYERSKGSVVFLARDGSGKALEQVLAEHDLKSLGLVTSREQRRIVGADYFLGGDFIALGIMEKQAAQVVGSQIGASENDPRMDELRVESGMVAPQGAKFLNLMLINADTAEIAFQKMLPVERKMQSGLGNADYLLTGEISALSKAAEGGLRSDYVIMSFQLVNPATNELLWEDAYETKRATSRSVLYR